MAEEKKTVVQFVVSYNGYNANEVAGFDASYAARLVQVGYAKYHNKADELAAEKAMRKQAEEEGKRSLAMSGVENFAKDKQAGSEVKKQSAEEWFLDGSDK